MINADTVLSLVKEKGPLIPRDVVKELGGDTFLTGALLSQLVESKLLKISRAKIGGSPVYYAVGQEEGLEILYKSLNEKDKRGYDILKEKKVLRDIECEPLLRISLRNLKDFAQPFQVIVGDTEEIFWKWHLFSDEETEKLVNSMFSVAEEHKEIESPKAQETPQKEKPREKEVQHTLDNKEQKEEKESFADKISHIFREKNIEVIESKVIKKQNEIEYIVKAPSIAGKTYFFVKARDKKKTSDKDLSLMYIQGQTKKLPVLFMTTGDLTKKAYEMLDAEFRSISVLKI
ncbi:MAG: hypothetical protein NDI94_00760 [Candidatus Woesearchaeota archaeon]|nr:hypothetical protein [Candidatus Woesearchaeota archaeon]